MGNSNPELEAIFRKLSNPSKKLTKKAPPKKGSVNQLKNKPGTHVHEEHHISTQHLKTPTAEQLRSKNFAHPGVFLMERYPACVD
ncbi:hypothetical protein AOLI_G00079920 [Acnodon oligacanthus]